MNQLVNATIFPVVEFSNFSGLHIKYRKKEGWILRFVTLHIQVLGTNFVAKGEGVRGNVNGHF